MWPWLGIFLRWRDFRQQRKLITMLQDPNFGKPKEKRKTINTGPR